MAKFSYFNAPSSTDTPQTSRTSQAVRTAQPTPPPSNLNFFDINRYDAQAWSNVGEQIQNAGQVVSEVLGKLKESEHQNNADEFYLKYTEKIGILRDNINSGQAKSNQYDMTDLTGRSNYYKSEEEKIYGDLSNEFNRESYKRRNSLMLERKSRPYLDGLTSVRSNLIRHIAERNKIAWTAYKQGQAREGTELMLNHFMAVKRKDELGIEKTEKEIESLINNVKGEAKRRLSAGQMTLTEYKASEGSMKAKMQNALAFRLALELPQVFIDTVEDRASREKHFDNMDPVALAHNLSNAIHKVKALEKDEEKVASLDAKEKMLLDWGDVLSDQNVNTLQKFADRLKDKDSYPDIKDRTSVMQLRVQVIRQITSLKNQVKKKATPEEFRHYARSYFERSIQIDDESGLRPPLEVYDLDEVYKSDQDRRRYREIVNYQQKLINVAKQQLTIKPKQDILSELKALKPSNLDSGSYDPIAYSDMLDSYQTIKNHVVTYFTEKDKNKPGMIRREQGKPIVYDYNVESWTDAVDQFRNLQYDYEAIKRDTLSYSGKKAHQLAGSPQVLMAQKFQALSQEDMDLIKSNLNVKNLTQQWPVWRRALEHRYGKDAIVATKQLIDAKILPVWGQYAEFLSPEALLLHVEASELSVVPSDKLRGHSIDQQTAKRLFRHRIGRAIQNEQTRIEVENLYMKMLAQRVSKSGLQHSPTSLEMFTDEMFKGIALVKAPFQFENSQQDSIWFPQEKLDMWGLSSEEAAEAMEGWLLQFHSSPENRDVDWTLINSIPMSRDKLERKGLTSEQIDAAIGVRSSILSHFNEWIDGSIGDRSNTTVTVVMNHANELSMAVKSFPHGEVVRIGKERDGSIDPVSITVDDFLEFAREWQNAPAGEKWDRLNIGREILNWWFDNDEWTEALKRKETVTDPYSSD